MSERVRGVYAFLRYAAVYDALQRLIRPASSYRAFLERHVRPVEGMRVFDVGCGTGAILSYLPPVSYLGVDVNARYIECARSRLGARGTFVVGDGGERFAVADESIDLVLALGVLHHLADETAANIIAEAARVLVPGGRFVTHDPVLSSSGTRAARLFVRLDRGKYVRSRSDLVALVGGAFDEIETFLTTDSLRIPYQEIILECVKRQ